MCGVTGEKLNLVQRYTTLTLMFWLGSWGSQALFKSSKTILDVGFSYALYL